MKKKCRCANCLGRRLWNRFLDEKSSINESDPTPADLKLLGRAWRRYLYALSYHCIEVIENGYVFTE